VNDMPFWAQLLILLFLLLLSAFFSISETSLMAVNRYRIRHLAAKGNRGAKQVLNLLKRTDKLLGTILLGNNIVNAALTTLITALAINAFGNNDQVLAMATTIAALMLIIFAELIPKVSGANKPDGVAMIASYALIIFKWFLSPFVYILNRVVSVLLSAANLELASSKNEGLTREELRSAVLESSSFIPIRDRKLLLNLLDLEDLTVDHVMIPRGKIEYLNLEHDTETLKEQISTSFHNKLIVCNGDLNKIEGILYVKRAIGLILKDEFSIDSLSNVLQPIRYIPQGAKLFSELQNFQKRSETIAAIVDEYGEVEGILTVQDIIEELVGEFKSISPNVPQQTVKWNEQNEVIVDGLITVREINRQLNLDLPIDGPRTLNGLILEELEEFPEANLSLRICGITIEILSVQGRLINKVRLKIEKKKSIDNKTL
tara:strand:- start:57896 stop:59188 length:1293 start_codon:yes stop_codon:yes gene_type:complete